MKISLLIIMKMSINMKISLLINMKMSTIVKISLLIKVATSLLGRLSPLKQLTSIVHILSPKSTNINFIFSQKHVVGTH